MIYRDIVKRFHLNFFRLSLKHACFIITNTFYYYVSRFSHPLKREKRTEQVHISRKFSRFHICTNFTSHAFVSQRVHNYQSAHAIFRVHTIIAIVKSINSLFYRVLRTDDTGFIHSQIDVETNRCYVNAIVQMVDRQIDRKASRCCLFFFVPLFTD